MPYLKCKWLQIKNWTCVRYVIYLKCNGLKIKKIHSHITDLRIYSSDFFPPLGRCSFDLLTVAFQGQICLTVHDHRGPFFQKDNGLWSNKPTYQCPRLPGSILSDRACLAPSSAFEAAWLCHQCPRLPDSVLSVRGCLAPSSVSDDARFSWQPIGISEIFLSDDAL